MSKLDRLHGWAEKGYEHLKKIYNNLKKGIGNNKKVVADLQDFQDFLINKKNI